VYKVLAILTSCFTGFILWILYMANTNQHTMYFEIVQQTPYGDKIGHVVLFGLLTLFINLVTIGKSVCISSVNIYTGTVLVTVFVTFEEMSQLFFTSRTFDLLDYAASLIGVLMFSGITYLIENAESRRRKN